MGQKASRRKIAPAPQSERVDPPTGTSENVQSNDQDDGGRRRVQLTSNTHWAVKDPFLAQSRSQCRAQFGPSIRSEPHVAKSVDAESCDSEMVTEKRISDHQMGLSDKTKAATSPTPKPFSFLTESSSRSHTGFHSSITSDPPASRLADVECFDQEVEREKKGSVHGGARPKTKATNRPTTKVDPFLTTSSSRSGSGFDASFRNDPPAGKSADCENVHANICDDHEGTSGQVQIDYNPAVPVHLFMASSKSYDALNRGLVQLCRRRSGPELKKILKLRNYDHNTSLQYIPLIIVRGSKSNWREAMSQPRHQESFIDYIQKVNLGITDTYQRYSGPELAARYYSLSGRYVDCCPSISYIDLLSGWKKHQFGHLSKSKVKAIMSYRSRSLSDSAVGYDMIVLRSDDAMYYNRQRNEAKEMKRNVRAGRKGSIKPSTKVNPVQFRLRHTLRDETKISNPSGGIAAGNIPSNVSSSQYTPSEPPLIHGALLSPTIQDLNVYTSFRSSNNVYHSFRK